MGAYAFKCQKLLARYKNEPEYKELMKDISAAQQGIVSFSKEVKKYMIDPIRTKYQNNPEVSGLIDVLKNSVHYESYNFIEIFRLQDEAYFWWCFLQAYACWKIIQTKYEFKNEEDKLKVLVRLIKEDPTVFDEFVM